MKRKTALHASTGLVLLGAAFLMLAATGAGAADTPTRLGTALAGLALGLPFAALGIRRFRRLSRFIRQDYAWYRGTHRDGVDDAGRVACHVCHGHAIGTRSLMQRTYTRAHYCARCGTTLFFSCEGGRTR